MEHLSEEQIKALGELADSLMAMDRVRRMFTTALLWLSGSVTAIFIIWNVFSSFFGKHTG